MSEDLVVEPRFIQIGRQFLAVAEIVGGNISSSDAGTRVDVYLSAPVAGGSYQHTHAPNLISFWGEEAERFLVWWDHDADKIRL